MAHRGIGINARYSVDWPRDVTLAHRDCVDYYVDDECGPCGATTVGAILACLASGQPDAWYLWPRNERWSKWVLESEANVMLRCIANELPVHSLVDGALCIGERKVYLAGLAALAAWEYGHTADHDIFLIPEDATSIFFAAHDGLFLNFLSECAMMRFQHELQTVSPRLSGKLLRVGDE